LKKNSFEPFVIKRVMFERTRLIDHDNKFHDNFSTLSALNLAHANNLELVCFSKGDRDESPFCKIINYGKWKYENDKKRKKEQGAIKKETKELRFTPVIDDNDVRHKIKQAIDFLDKGDEVIFSMRLKGRQKHYFNDAEARMDDLVAMCKEHGSEVGRKKTSNTITVRVSKTHK